MEYVKFIVTIIIILVIFYIAETQRKSQEKETKKMQSEIKKDDKIDQFIVGKTVIKEIFVPGKIFNIVVKTDAT